MEDSSCRLEHDNQNLAKPSHWKSFWKWVSDYRWPIILIFWIITIVLGCVGFSIYLKSEGQYNNFLQVLYMTWQLFILHTIHLTRRINPYLQVARYLAPSVTSATAIVTLISIYYFQWQRLTLIWSSDHIVICGLGRVGIMLTEVYRREKRTVVVIERDGEHNTNIPKAKDYGAIVFIGDAADPEMLKKVRVQKADRCIACTGDDGLNIHIGLQASYALEKIKRDSPLKCSIHIGWAHLFNLFQMHQIMRNRHKEFFAVSTFNVHICGAQEIVTEFPPFKTPVDIKNPPRIVIIGLGRFGRALICEIAAKWAAEVEEGVKNNIPIMIIDEKAIENKEEIDILYPAVEQFCEINPINKNIEKKEFQPEELFCDKDGNPVVSRIYICLDNDRLGLQAALKILPHIKDSDIEVIVRTVEDKGYEKLINEAKKDQEYKNLRAFELIKRACTPKILSLFDEKLAKLLHQDYRNYYDELRNKGHKIEKKPAEDEWDNLPEIYRMLFRHKADFVHEILEKYGFCIVPDDNPKKGLTTKEWNNSVNIKKTPELDHKRWVADQIRMGWKRTDNLDLTEDAKKKDKLHTDLKPWKDISSISQGVNIHWVENLPDILANPEYKKKIVKK